MKSVKCESFLRSLSLCSTVPFTTYFVAKTFVLSRCSAFECLTIYIKKIFTKKVNYPGYTVYITSRRISGQLSALKQSRDS